MRRDTRPSRALLLLGHGSHLSPDSSAPVYAHAAAIRRAGRFDQVIEAFWKEEPSLRDALDLVDADEALVVPLFLAEGYFTREVLPRELGLEERRASGPPPLVRYCLPVGAHPAMADLILRRARAAARDTGAPLDRTALVVIGHGTERSNTSGATVHALVDRLRRQSDFALVTCGFLDEAPSIADVVEAVDQPNVVLVPFFVAEGWHTRETIPRDLGLAGPVTRRAGRTLLYTPPVGTLPEVADLVVAIAEEVARAPDAPNAGQGGRMKPPLERSPEREGRGIDRAPDAPSASPGSPLTPPATLPGQRPAEIVLARRAFFDGLDLPVGASRAFLQVAITARPDGRFALRHRDDAPPDLAAGPAPSSGNAHDAALGLAAGPVPSSGNAHDAPPDLAAGPVPSSGSAHDAPLGLFVRPIPSPADAPRSPGSLPEDPSLDGSAGRAAPDPDRLDRLDHLRARALAIARFGPDGRYRPLRSADDLPRGWSFDALTPDELWEVLSLLYPAAVLHWHRAAAGDLRVVPFRGWAARQTALYASLRDLHDHQVDDVVRSTCGACLRHRAWPIDPDAPPLPPPPAGAVPCREPCTVFASAARELGATPVTSAPGLEMIDTK